MKKQGGDNKSNKPTSKGAIQVPLEALLDDERWLEQLEHENDAEFEADLERLLKNSSADRGIFSSLEKTRKLIKSSDDVLMPESGHYYQDLHDRIMATIDAEAQDVRRVPSPKTLRSAKFAWPAMLGTLTMSMVLGVVTWFTVMSPAPMSSVASHYHGEQVERTQQAVGDATEIDDVKLAEVSSRSYSESLVGFETESDVVANAAAEHLMGLDSASAEQLLNDLKR